MQSSERESREPARNTKKLEESLSRTNEYAVVYASSSVKKDFEKAFRKFPGDDVAAIKAAIKRLKSDPRQRSKKLKECGVPADWYRIRVGRYRILYDIHDDTRTVVLTVIAIRNERTYRL